MSLLFKDEPKTWKKNEKFSNNVPWNPQPSPFVLQKHIQIEAFLHFCTKTCIQTSMFTCLQIYMSIHIYIFTYMCNIYIYTYKHKYIHKYQYIYINKCMHIYKNKHINYTYTYTYAKKNVYIKLRIRIYKCVYIYIYIFTPIHIQIYTHMHVYICTQTHKQFFVNELRWYPQQRQHFFTIFLKRAAKPSAGNTSGGFP